MLNYNLTNLAESGCLANSLSTDSLTDLLTEDGQTIQMNQHLSSMYTSRHLATDRQTYKERKRDIENTCRKTDKHTD